MKRSDVVELGISPDLRRQEPADEVISAAAAAGFSVVGLGSHQCDRAAADRAAAAGVDCREVMALLVSSTPEKNVAAAEALASAVEAVGAAWLATVFFARPTPEVLASLSTAGTVLAGVGARLAIEFSPLGPVATLADGLAAVDAIGTDVSGVLVDSWHFCRGGGTWDELAAAPLDRLAYVQFADALPPVGDDLMAETIDRRALPGEGELELDRFATTLLGRGFDGLVMAEVLSADLRRRPIGDAAVAVHAATERYWR